MEQKENGDPNYGGAGEPLRVTDKRGAARAAEGLDELREEIVAAQAEEPITLNEEELAALLAQHAAGDDSNAEPKPQVLTAFIVLIDHDGNVQAQSALDVLDSVDVSRAATFSDMYSAACHIQKDISGQEVTHRVMMGIAQQAQAVQQAAMSNRFAAPPGLTRR